MRSVFLCTAAASLLMGSEPAPPRLRAVEERYNNLQSLQVDFEQHYLVHGRGKKIESGRLSVLRPRRMLWQYREPEGKFFLADGKNVYLFSPRQNRVEKTSLKNSSDIRTPVGFLLGKLSFKRDFEDVKMRETPEGLEVTAYPKSDSFQVEKVVFVLSPANEIRKLSVTELDNSVMEILFSNERVNVPFADSVFRFLLPPGAEVVDIKTFDLQ